MRKQILVLIFILIGLQTIIFAQDDNTNSYEYLKLKINQEIEFQINFENEYNVNTFNVYSYFFPQTFENAQSLNSFTSNLQNYNLIKIDEIPHLKYNFDKSNLKTSNKISNEFIIESIVNRPKITEKVEYPLSKENKDKYQKYLEYSSLIDIDDDIKTQASNLAKGEDDVYIIASKVAKWIIEDVDYDLSSVLANPNQKSSEVFKSKNGVCKEITNLYISMMRSLGIPTRVVTGYSYTTSEELIDFVGSSWGGHAWAEVLIGDTWVPFDLTYNQYGFVDSTHIITDKFTEIRGRSAQINATGYGFKITPNSLKTDTEFEIIDSRDIPFNPGFEITLSGHDKLGFNSYGYIEVNAHNTENFYQLLFLNINNKFKNGDGTITEIELLDSSEKMLVFKPNEKKTTYFRFKIPEIDEGYTYTFPITIYNQFVKKEFNLKVDKDSPVIKKIGLPEEEIENKSLSNNKLDFDCNYIIKEITNSIICSVANYNNYEITNLKICQEENCQSLYLKLNEVQSFKFETENLEETIKFSYNNESGKLKIGAVIPKIQIITKKLSYDNTNKNNVLGIEYDINDSIENLVLEVLLNDEIIKLNSVPEEKKLQINLNEGNNSITMNLKIGDKILDNKFLNYEITKEDIKNLKKENTKNLNFFEKILYYITNFITF